jgi:hypothetical protein
MTDVERCPESSDSHVASLKVQSGSPLTVTQQACAPAQTRQSALLVAGAPAVTPPAPRAPPRGGVTTPMLPDALVTAGRGRQGRPHKRRSSSFVTLCPSRPPSRGLSPPSAQPIATTESRPEPHSPNVDVLERVILPFSFRARPSRESARRFPIVSKRLGARRMPRAPEPPRRASALGALRSRVSRRLASRCAPVRRLDASLRQGLRRTAAEAEIFAHHRTFGVGGLAAIRSRSAKPVRKPAWFAHVF